MLAMTPAPTRPTFRRRLLLRTLAAATMLVVATPGVAAPGAILEVYFGPSQTGWLAVDSLRVRLDGQEIPVRLPAGDDPPGTPLYSRPVAPGPHLIEMAAVLRGASAVSPYVEGYRFDMRGHLDVTAPAGNVLGVHGRVLASSEATTEWTARYALALDAAAYPSDRAAAAETPVQASPPPAEPLAGEPAAATQVLSSPLARATETAPPGAPSVTPPATGCAFPSVRFGFDQATLTSPARQALGRFAACVAPGSSPIRLDGHSDVRGSAGYNLALGERRATAVARHLESRGVAAGRISTRSFGMSSPLCGESTEACGARNRRVEAVIGE
jgi:peptidoglycan-associated lipoprotein